jgi:hypothetical protein
MQLDVREKTARFVHLPAWECGRKSRTESLVVDLSGHAMVHFDQRPDDMI